MVLDELKKQKLVRWLRAQAYHKHSVIWPEGDAQGNYLLIDEIEKYLPEFLEELLNE